MAQTYYDLLQVAENATSEEIEVAFKNKAREVHPDKVAPGNPYLRKIAAEAFKDLSEAKSTLLDPAERRKYDAQLASMRGPQASKTTSVHRPSSYSTPAPPHRLRSTHSGSLRIVNSDISYSLCLDSVVSCCLAQSREALSTYLPRDFSDIAEPRAALLATRYEAGYRC